MPALIAAGHEVTGTTRSSERAGAIADAGATPVLVDAFDARALARAVAEARPDAVVNQLTDLPQAPSARGIKAAYAANNRARGEGGRNLLAAARAAGVERYVAQSVAFFYRPTGEPGRRDEDTPLRTDAPGIVGEAAQGGRGTPRATRSRQSGVVLRYGFLVRARHLVLGRFGGSPRACASAASRSSGTGAGLLLVRARRGRRGGDGRRPRRAVRALQRRRRRPGAHLGVAARFAAAIGAPPPRKLPELPVRLLGGRALVEWLGIPGTRGQRTRADDARLDRAPRDVADGVPRPVRFRHGAHGAKDEGERVSAVLDVLRPRDQALLAASRRIAPRCTSTTIRSAVAATWAACTRSSRRRSTSSCSPRPRRAARASGWSSSPGSRASAARSRSSARSTDGGVRQPPLLRLARGRAGRRTRLRPSRPALTEAARKLAPVKDRLHGARRRRNQA